MLLDISLSRDEDEDEDELVEEMDDSIDDEPEEAPHTTTHDVLVKALKNSGFSVVSDPGKMGKSIVVTLGSEKDFVDVLAKKLTEKFNKVGKIFEELGGQVELVPGKGDRTIKYWGSISLEGKTYNIDFTYRVGQGSIRMVKG